MKLSMAEVIQVVENKNLLAELGVKTEIKAMQFLQSTGHYPENT